MKHHLKQVLGTWVPAVCLLVAIIYAQASANKPGPGHGAPEKTAEQSSPSSAPLPRVDVMEVTSGTEQAVVSATGEVRSRYQVTLSAEVSGTVKKVADELAAGCRVKAGQCLLTLDDTNYRQSLADARKTLAAANLALLQQQRKADQAKEDWSRSGLSGKPASKLVLGIPQLKSAQAAVEAAEAGLEKAKRDLERTLIRAPFDGVVVARSIAPGSYVSPGTSIATLYSSDRAEVRLPLSARQWALLPEDKILESGEWTVHIRSVQGTDAWEGRAIRVERHMGDTRQRALIVAVSDPLSRKQPLMPGAFVSAEVPGIPFDHMLRLPSGAMTSEGYVWHVNGEGNLERFRTDPLFQDRGEIYVKAPEGKTDFRILKQPVSGYLSGMKVAAVKENNS